MPLPMSSGRIPERHRAVGYLLMALGAAWLVSLVFHSLDVLFVLAVAASIAYSTLRWRSQRSERLVALARRLGLRYVAGDPFGISNAPFDLFTMSHHRRDGSTHVQLFPHQIEVRNVMWGEWRGTPVTAFEASPPVAPGFPCAIMPFPTNAPRLSVERRAEGIWQVDATIGETDVIELESIAFGRAFRVRSVDRAFAVALLDPDLMTWLMDVRDAPNFELYRDRLLAYWGRGTMRELDLLVAMSREVCRRVPSVARTYAPA